MTHCCHVLHWTFHRAVGVAHRFSSLLRWAAMSPGRRALHFHEHAQTSSQCSSGQGHKLSTRSAEVRCVSQQIWSEVSEVCERLMDPQALRVWLLPSRLLFGFFLMSLHLFGSLDCRLGWCSLCIIMLASWVAPSIAASSESIYRDPMKSVDAPPDSDVAGTRKNQRPLGGGS